LLPKNEITLELFFFFTGKIVASKNVFFLGDAQKYSDTRVFEGERDLANFPASF
jgi:hypothetical protein